MCQLSQAPRLLKTVACCISISMYTTMAGPAAVLPTASVRSPALPGRNRPSVPAERRHEFSHRVEYPAEVRQAALAFWRAAVKHNLMARVGALDVSVRGDRLTVKPKPGWQLTHPLRREYQVLTVTVPETIPLEAPPADPEMDGEAISQAPAAEEAAAEAPVATEGPESSQPPTVAYPEAPQGASAGEQAPPQDANRPAPAWVLQRREERCQEDEAPH